MSRASAAVAIVLVIVIGLAALYYEGDVKMNSGGMSTVSEPLSSVSGNSSVVTGTNSSTQTVPVSSTGSSSASNPLFVGNSSTIGYPANYDALANFTLALINKDRAAASLAPVTLSTVPSGQQHADSMSYYGYFSHWDNQGYKPYMRYSLLGGTGGVSENVAEGSCTDSSWQRVRPCTVQTIENSLNDSEWQMMNNDSICCSNGHRENILNPLHNRVSIGVAYNPTTQVAYLVEDFEDDYISSGSLQLSGGVVTFQGSTQQDLTGWTGGSSGAEISVYYDATPLGIPVGDLNPKATCTHYSELNEPASCKYQGAYGQGTELTTVLAPCPGEYVCASGNFTYAQTWQQGNGKFDIVF